MSIRMNFVCLAKIMNTFTLCKLIRPRPYKMLNVCDQNDSVFCSSAFFFAAHLCDEREKNVEKCIAFWFGFNVSNLFFFVHRLWFYVHLVCQFEWSLCASSSTWFFFLLLRMHCIAFRNGSNSQCVWAKYRATTCQPYNSATLSHTHN